MSKDIFINEYLAQRPLYKKLGQKVSLIVEEILEQKEVNFHAVSFRAKTVDSFSKKIEKPKYDDPLNQLTDLTGVRIIAYVENDVKEISTIIENLFDIDSDNSIDKSKELGIDRVGYKSVHYICSLRSDRLCLPEFERFSALKFEIQIRTILQHAWAEIEHDKNYKFAGVLPEHLQRQFKLLAAQLELTDQGFNKLSADIDNYSKEVKVSFDGGDFDAGLNTTSIKNFLNLWSHKLNIGSSDFNGRDSQIIAELEKYGIRDIKELNEFLERQEGLLQNLIVQKTYIPNYLGLLRDLMIIEDIDKYFKNSYDGQWKDRREDEIMEIAKIDWPKYLKYFGPGNDV